MRHLEPYDIGVHAYSMGCRCDRCREEATARRHTDRRRKKPDKSDTSWMDRAACRGVDTRVFFIEPGGDVRPAKAICATCPVRVECREYGRVIGATAGIWGGESVHVSRPGGRKKPPVRNFAARFTAERKRRGYTQQQAAVILGVARSAIAAWEASTHAAQHADEVLAHLRGERSPVSAVEFARILDAIPKSDRTIADRIGTSPASVTRWRAGHPPPIYKRNLYIERMEKLWPSTTSPSKVD